MSAVLKKCEVCSEMFLLTRQTYRNRMKRDSSTLSICGPNCIAARKFMLDTTPNIELGINKHGVYNSYYLGCRCDPCRAENNKRAQKHRDRAKAKGTFVKSRGLSAQYTCAMCGKKFMRETYRVKESQKESNSGNVFCGRSCSALWNTRNKRWD